MTNIKKELYAKLEVIDKVLSIIPRNEVVLRTELIEFRCGLIAKAVDELKSELESLS